MAPHVLASRIKLGQLSIIEKIVTQSIIEIDLIPNIGDSIFPTVCSKDENTVLEQTSHFFWAKSGTTENKRSCNLCMRD